MNKKTLIIVESPAKSNTISRYLGKEYVVSSSMGHIRDLNPNILSIDIENNYKPHYEELKEKKEVIRDLKRKAKGADKILLAPDPDREGEAIAFHLQEILKDVNGNIYRILFYEITRDAVNKGIGKLLQIDANKVNSQQMRRLLDRLAGYKISPILQRKLGGPLSAGRVQSIALKLIVEREKEVQAFVPEEYWLISVELEGSQPPIFIAKLEKHKGRKIKISNQAESDFILDSLKSHDFILKSLKKRKKKRKPSPPLITSTLQQEAFKRHRFPVKKTMKLAQQLYEGIALSGSEVTGLITYMRTDSFRISVEGREGARKFIEKNFGPSYYPEKPNVYTSKKKIQDAHEAIRPTLPLHQPDAIRHHLNDAQYKIYTLIWERFLASQMSNAEIEETVFEVANGDYLFGTRGEIVTFPGHLKVLKPSEKGEQLPDLKEGEVLAAKKIIPKQNFTTPPPRYTEAGLVKVLEEKGIGRPSTYATIIDTLGKRDYVIREERRFVPTFLGIRVVEYLEDNFKNIMNYSFTADLEKELDQVSEGSLDWVKGIDQFYKKLSQSLEAVKDKKNVELFIGKSCPQCNRELIQKYSRKTRGWFVGCSGYPDCKYTESLNNIDSGGKEDQVMDKHCPKCGERLVKRFSPKSRQYFIGCTGYPKCTYIESQKKEMGTCPQCGKPLVRKFSRKTRRFFVGCSGYPECNYIGGGKSE